MKNLILVHLESVSELILKTSPDLFPNINNIIQESAYYKNYFSSATSTLMVMSDLCYGGMYREKCTELESDFNSIGGYISLFDELVNRGYNARGIIWPQLSTYSKIINGYVLGKNIKIISTESYKEFIECIDESLKQKEPFALFVGNFVSHISYRNIKEINGSDSYTRWKEGYKKLDDTCGHIFEFIKKNGHETDTIIVFYGDHGDDYWGHRLHNGYTHAIEPYSSIIHTPLFIWNVSQKKETEYKLISTLDIKVKILNMLFDAPSEGDRKYVFSRNIYVNQKSDVMSLSKGYAVATEEYILLVSIRGLELYNIDMDPTNTCNLLEFFNIDAKGQIKFCLNFKDIRSMHFRDFFTDGEVRHLRRVYIQLRKKLLLETEKIYRTAGKDISDRNKDLNFAKINRCHSYNRYKKEIVDKIEKYFRKRQR